MIDRATINKIMDATDIVDVIKEFVTLRKAGVNYKALCPFHDEKTPSFVVSPAKQMFKCFSCGKGGNAVHFIMEHEQMSYPEAIKWLGRKYGIEVKEKELTDEEKREESERESMFVLNEWARDYFTDVLRNHADGIAIGMAYFRKRGFRDDTISKFQLGYSLASRDALALAAQTKGFKREFLVKTGLCYEADNGRLLDRYHGRVIFPVHTISGKVVAFGGRVLNTDGKVAKYVNSPESEIYHKSDELYGIYFAKHAIVKQNRCFLVEGYTDVISMHQSGIENVVASSGTSLTHGQIRLLHRFTENITILYDGDSAGIKASLRGIDMLLAEGLNIKVLLLPDGEDPDSFALHHDAQYFQKYIDEHQVDFIKFKTDLLMADCGNDPIKKAGLISNIVQSITVIPNAIVRQMYIHECASKMGIDEKLVAEEVGKSHRKLKYEERNSKTKGSEVNAHDETPEEAKAPSQLPSLNGRESQEEKLLITMIVKYGSMPFDQQEDENGIEHPETVTSFIANDLSHDGLEFRNPLYNTILKEATEHDKVPDFNSMQYFLNHPDQQISLLAADVSEDKYQLSRYHFKFKAEVKDKDRLGELIPRLLHDFKYSIVKEELQKLLKQLHSPEILSNSEKCMAVMERYKELSEVERQLAQVLGDRVVTL